MADDRTYPDWQQVARPAAADFERVIPGTEYLYFGTEQLTFGTEQLAFVNNESEE